MTHDNEIITLANGDITLWLEQDSSIHIRAVSQRGDPVELNSEEAKELADRLLRLASTIE